MTSEFLKSNPMALRHCLLYEFLNGKNGKEAYAIFCEKVGKMVFENDKKAVRVCILYESLKSNLSEKDPMEDLMDEFYRFMGGFAPRVQMSYDPIFDSSKRMCKVLGDDVIGYQEYYAYYQRFARKEFDLEDLEKKDGDKKTMTLSDMPIEVIEVIGQKLKVYDRCAVRKVSRSLREFMDDTIYEQERVYLKATENHAEIGDYAMSFERINYLQVNGDCLVSRLFSKGTIKSMTPFKAALQDLKILFKNPKFKLEELHIGFDKEHAKEYIEVFKDLKPEFRVQNVNLFGDIHDYAWTILPYMKPGILQQINLEGSSSKKLDVRIFELDQWKQAIHHESTNPFTYPIGNLFHFKSFTVFMPTFCAEDVRKVKWVLQTPGFIGCAIRFSQENEYVIKKAVGHPFVPVAGSSVIFQIIFNDDFLICKRIR